MEQKKQEPLIRVKKLTQRERAEADRKYAVDGAQWNRDRAIEARAEAASGRDVSLMNARADACAAMAEAYGKIEKIYDALLVQVGS